MKHLFRLALFILEFLFCADVVFATEGRMQVVSAIDITGGSCQRDGFSILAGSTFTLNLSSALDKSLRIPEPGWPTGYVLEAALDLLPNQPFVATPGLIDQLTPFPFLDGITVYNRQKLLDGDSASVDRDYLNTRCFILSAPPSLSGHTLTFRAQYQRDDLSLEGFHRTLAVIAPCDRQDTARIVTSWLASALERAEVDRVIALTDSMLAVGLSDPIALDLGMLAANNREQYDKQLAYLERLYSDFGITDFHYGITDYWSLFPAPPPTDWEQQRYQQLRSELLELIARQQ